MGFEVVVADINAAAKKLKAAASGVKGADPSADVDDIAIALPGSKSGPKATALSTAWKSRFKKWHDDAVTEAGEQKKSADSYDAADYAADLRQRQFERHHLRGVQ
ncbi:hypothetical protein ASG90_09040 [Nocardioides sp. Soil797]|nr:hypothetical protein ASG90_09040 [Nocardioides sp. Soil797]